MIDRWMLAVGRGFAVARAGAKGSEDAIEARGGGLGDYRPTQMYRSTSRKDCTKLRGLLLTLLT